MEIHYGSNKIRKLLNDKRLLKKYFAKEFEAITMRLKEFEAVSNLSRISHLPPPRRHKLSGNYSGCFAVDISKNKRIIFKPLKEEWIELVDITAIVIIDIKDYH